MIEMLILVSLNSKYSPVTCVCRTTSYHVSKS